MIKDFQDYLTEVKEVHPEANDRMIFEGWAIQKKCRFTGHDKRISRRQSTIEKF